MHINTSINKSKKPRGRPKKAKVVQSSFALGGQPIVKTFKKKLPTRKKKTSKLVLVHDIKSGHNILMPLSTIKNNPSRFKLITKEE